MSDYPDYYNIYGAGAQGNFQFPDTFDPDHIVIVPTTAPDGWSAPSTSSRSHAGASSRGSRSTIVTSEYPIRPNIIDVSPSWASSSHSQASSQHTRTPSQLSQSSSRYSQASSQHSQAPSYHSSQPTAIPTPSRHSSSHTTPSPRSSGGQYPQDTYSQSSRSGNRVDNWQANIPAALNLPHPPPSIRSTSSSLRRNTREPDVRSVTSLRSGSVKTHADPEYYDARPEDARTTMGVEDVEMCRSCKRTTHEFRRHGHGNRCPFRTGGY